jgi:hypothetical protein
MKIWKTYWKNTMKFPGLGQRYEPASMPDMRQGYDILELTDWAFLPGMSKEKGVWKMNEKKCRDCRFQVEYFSGLSWRDAPIDKKLEYSDNGEDWSYGGQTLATATEPSDDNNYRPFTSSSGLKWYFCRTCPETYRDNHPTITIGGVELPRPEGKAPAEGTAYYCFDPAYTGRFTRQVWKGLYIDHLRLNNRCVHLTESRAKEWADWWRDCIIAKIKEAK